MLVERLYRVGVVAAMVFSTLENAFASIPTTPGPSGGYSNVNFQTYFRKPGHFSAKS